MNSYLVATKDSENYAILSDLQPDISKVSDMHYLTYLDGLTMPTSISLNQLLQDTPGNIRISQNRFLKDPRLSGVKLDDTCNNVNYLHPIYKKQFQHNPLQDYKRSRVIMKMLLATHGIRKRILKERNNSIFTPLLLRSYKNETDSAQMQLEYLTYQAAQIIGNQHARRNEAEVASNKMIKVITVDQSADGSRLCGTIYRYYNLMFQENDTRYLKHLGTQMQNDMSFYVTHHLVLSAIYRIIRDYCISGADSEAQLQSLQNVQPLEGIEQLHMIGGRLFAEPFLSKCSLNRQN